MVSPPDVFHRAEGELRVVNGRYEVAEIVFDAWAFETLEEVTRRRAPRVDSGLINESHLSSRYESLKCGTHLR